MFFGHFWPTYHAQHFLLHNVWYLGAFLDPPTYPKVGCHLKTLPDKYVYINYYYMNLFLILQRAWFGGDFASIVGECACPRGMYFDQHEMYCRQNFMGSSIGMAVIGICVLVGLCCCCGLCFVANKMRGWRKTDCWGWYRCKITCLLDRMMPSLLFIPLVLV